MRMRGLQRRVMGTARAQPALEFYIAHDALPTGLIPTQKRRAGLALRQPAGGLTIDNAAVSPAGTSQIYSLATDSAISVTSP